MELALRWRYYCLIKWLLRELHLFPCFKNLSLFLKTDQRVMVRNTKAVWMFRVIWQEFPEDNKRAREARLSASPPVQHGSPDESSTAHTHQRRVWILHWSRCTCCFQELEKDRHSCSGTVWKDENRQCVLLLKPKKKGWCILVEILSQVIKHT